MIFKRHQHRWRDVERTYTLRYANTFREVRETQWILQWCETCGKYKQTKIQGSSRIGPPPLRTPVPEAFLKEE